MKIEICDEEISNLKCLLEDKDIMKIAFDKLDVWPFTVREIIKTYEQTKRSETIIIEELS